MPAKNMFKNIYTYRHYLLGSFWSELRYRYAGTALGFFWFIINPMLEVLIYAVVFTQLVSIRSGGQGVSYTLYLVSGLFPWLVFAQFLQRGSNAIASNALYMRRSLIPSEIFVFKEFLISLFTLVIYLILLVPISIIVQNPITLSALLMPFLATLLLLLGYGMALALANLRVLFPDMKEIISFILQLWRWTLPIIYSDENFPDTLQKIMRINPPYYFIQSFRTVLIEHIAPANTAWLIMFFWIALSIGIGSKISSWLRSEVKDLL